MDVNPESHLATFFSVLQIGIVLKPIRIWLSTSVLDPTFYFDPDPTFYFDLDPYPLFTLVPVSLESEVS
jgi:hypothetical protein